jgi:hypothetical protein
MKLAFIVLAHQRPAQLALLLSSLQHPAARTYLHIDRRARIAPFESEFARHGIAEVELLPRHDSRWGGIGAVDAALEGLGRGLRERCDYFVLLSGQDFPLRPIAETAEFFAERRKRSYVGYFSLPDSWRIRTEFYSYSVFGRPETVFPRGEEPALSLKGKALNGLLRLWTTRKPPRRFPSYLRPFGGSSWWNLSAEAARFALRFVDDHPDYRAYHRYTLAPDEIFFHSILLGTSFGEAHPIVNDPLRFTIWPPHSSHPKTLRSDDLPAMLESGKPFGRKFDLQLDRSVIENLPA